MKLAEQVCAEQSVLTQSQGLVENVREALSSAGGRPPTLREIAHALRTSQRTLQRSLHATGTSYQRMLEEWRRRRAEEWVRSSRLTSEQIAERLGFSGARSFRRAFRRWTGKNPGEFRSASEA